MPDAVLSARVRVGVVGAAELAVWRRDLVFTTTFLAVVLVFVQSKPVVTHTLVRSGGVFAFVLTTAVVDGALVHV